MTRNISGSGILFAADALSAVDEPIEFTFALPGRGAAHVIGVGRIVRVVPAADSTSPYLAAACIESYRLEPQSAAATL